jgi:hypothetical protein
MEREEFARRERGKVESSITPKKRYILKSRTWGKNANVGNDVKETMNMLGTKK